MAHRRPCSQPASSLIGSRTFRIRCQRTQARSHDKAWSLLVACHAPLAVLNIQTWRHAGWREHLDLGMIRDLKSGQLLTARQLAERLASASHVLVGEQRNNPDHHALQLWLLQALSDRRPQGSLLLEMLTMSQQVRVDATRASIATSDYPTDLPQALEWRSEWDWQVYGPVLRFALAQPYPLLAANLESQDATVLSGHMARCLLNAATPAMLFASVEHVRKDTGVPRQMAELDVDCRQVVLVLAQKGEPVTPEVADYVWHTSTLP